MEAMAIAYEDLPVRDDGFTVDDLADMPADGRRYELVDGVLLVSPAPRWEHQIAIVTLAVVLREACTCGLRVLLPLDVRSGPRTSVEPDLLVLRSTELVRGRRWDSVPVLAVEVLSPSSTTIDRVLKRRVYEALGVPSYWIVDAEEPSVTVLTLVDGAYEQTGYATGDTPLTATAPFEVTVVPARLLDLA